MKRKFISLFAGIVAVAMPMVATAQSASPNAAGATAQESEKQSEESKSDQIRRQGEGLIYSVDRTP